MGRSRRSCNIDGHVIQEKRLPFLGRPYVREVEIYCSCSPRSGLFIMTRRLEVNIVCCCTTNIEPRRCVAPYFGRRSDAINQDIEPNVGMKVLEANKNKFPSSARMLPCSVYLSCSCCSFPWQK